MYMCTCFIFFELIGFPTNFLYNKTMKIILLSDTHLQKEDILKVKEKYADADYIVHCGDCLMSAKQMEELGIIAVEGNMDIGSGLPAERILEIEDFRILIIHGHMFYEGWYPDYRFVARYAKHKNCNVAFCGHSHEYFDKIVNDVHILNPGSTWKPRDPNSIRTYMVLNMQSHRIEVEKHPATDLYYKYL